MQFVLPDATILAFQFARDGLKEVERQHQIYLRRTGPTTECRRRFSNGCGDEARVPNFCDKRGCEAVRGRERTPRIFRPGLNVTLLEKPFTFEECARLLLKM